MLDTRALGEFYRRYDITEYDKVRSFHRTSAELDGGLRTSIPLRMDLPISGFETLRDHTSRNPCGGFFFNYLQDETWRVIHRKVLENPFDVVHKMGLTDRLDDLGHEKHAQFILHMRDMEEAFPREMKPLVLKHASVLLYDNAPIMAGVPSYADTNGSSCRVHGGFITELTGRMLSVITYPGHYASPWNESLPYEPFAMHPITKVTIVDRRPQFIDLRTGRDLTTNIVRDHTEGYRWNRQHIAEIDPRNYPIETSIPDSIFDVMVEHLRRPGTSLGPINHAEFLNEEHAHHELSEAVIQFKRKQENLPSIYRKH